MEKYILLGGKWGWSSYELGEDAEKKIPSTNYADCWNIPYINLCHKIFNNEEMVGYLNMNKKTVGRKARLPVIWFWESGAFFDIKELSQATDFFEAYTQYQRDMQERAIAELGDRKTLIIGALSDPPADGWPDNIKILSTSCQTHLNKLAGTNIQNLPYSTIKDDLYNQSIKPSKQLAYLMFDWKKSVNRWTELGYFTDTHPTKKFIELFAKETEKEITEFINNSQE